MSEQHQRWPLLGRLRGQDKKIPSAPAGERKVRKRPDPARHLVRQIGDCIPGGTTKQFSAITLLARKLDRVPRADADSTMQVLDFGAGLGDRLPELRKVLTDFDYTGIDLTVPEDDRHAGERVRFVAYDGYTMPFEDASFDLVFSKQVLEHVRHPDQAISEISRVLRPGGVFAGSCSFLEPYHAFSIFNWTPYGLATVFKDHGFEDIELRPGIDGASMVLRTLYATDAFARSFAGGSGFNHHVDIEHADEGARLRNARKLAITGHLCFFAVKPGGMRQPDSGITPPALA